MLFGNNTSQLLCSLHVQYPLTVIRLQEEIKFPRSLAPITSFIFIMSLLWSSVFDLTLHDILIKELEQYKSLWYILNRLKIV